MAWYGRERWSGHQIAGPPRRREARAGGRGFVQRVRDRGGTGGVYVPGRTIGSERFWS